MVHLVHYYLSGSSKWDAWPHKNCTFCSPSPYPFPASRIRDLMSTLLLCFFQIPVTHMLLSHPFEPTSTIPSYNRLPKCFPFPKTGSNYLHPVPPTPVSWELWGQQASIQFTHRLLCFLNLIVNLLSHLPMDWAVTVFAGASHRYRSV